MQKSTKILLIVFIVSFLVIVFGGSLFDTPEPAIGASHVEIQRHLVLVTVPFAILNFAMTISGVILVMRVGNYIFKKN